MGSRDNYCSWSNGPNAYLPLHHFLLTIRLILELSKNLTYNTQVSLLRARSAEHLILGCAQRSYQFTSYQATTVLLSNNFVIQRNSPNTDADMSAIAARILDQICEPMRDINVNLFLIQNKFFKI